MESTAEFVKEFMLPGSLSFLLIGLTLGVVAMFGGRKVRAWGRGWLASLAAAYWLLSTPLLAGALEAALGPGYTSVTDRAALQGAEAIVVLGGGSAIHRAPGGEIHLLSDSSALRAIEAARLYRMMDDPWVIASGGTTEMFGGGSAESEAMCQALVRLGVPAGRILLETASQNTHGQALALGPLLEAHGIRRFVLVTSPTHMRRALATFQAAGLEPIPSVSAQHSEAMPLPAFPLQPDLAALEASKVALREVIALGYYTARGWLRGP